MGGGGDANADPNLTPLLDVVLQLIMFFMITVNFVRVDHISEQVNLPIAQAAVPMEKTTEEWVFLNINDKGRLMGAMEQFNAPGELELHLKKRIEQLERTAQLQGEKGDLKIILVLRADKEVRFEQLWDYMETGKRAGIKRFQFRAMKKQG